MPNRFSIVEPHPSIPRDGGYIAAGGRGGAGNYRRYQVDELTSGPSAQGPPSRQPITARSSTTSVPVSVTPSARARVFASTGIGGAGNMFARAETEERVFQFDEEMIKRRDATSTPVYHIGRGGGGNWVDESARPHPAASHPSRVTRQGSASSDASSASSAASSHDGSEVSASGAAGQVRRSVEGALGRLRDRFTS